MSSEEPPELLSCDQCGNLAVGTGSITCCETTMTPAEPVDAVAKPDLEALLRDVFQMSDTELEVCLCVMEGGTMTVKELAERIDYDRSVISRHLNHLAELGVVEKQRRLIEQGGHVYVYQPVPPETVHERLTAAFVTWVHGATEKIGTLRQEKVASIADIDDEPAWTLFRED
ncbi:ArsR family transcriptional regulator [Halonotius terrestris]|uniref:ArsR family transcriptional regulator n=1 Tax=Halonotius terrestris TaxID=2487750 RepID=A0A8J8TAW9_9EURY|nr:helix-turn-helix domain-containing protein [Halonotius terrestris]TQQ79818.1 ArsR family transcriptional regulator [Halonotius terrestris]